MSAVDMASSDQSDQSTNLSVLRFPDEILNRILWLSCLARPETILKLRGGGYEPLVDKLSIENLSLVCQRFRRLAAPFIYHEVEAQFLISGSRRTFMPLYQQFKKDPLLRPFCRRLVLGEGSLDQAESDLALDFATWLTNITLLELYCSQDNRGVHFWESVLKRALALAPRLSTVYLHSSFGRSIDLRQLFNVLCNLKDHSGLRKLKIYGVQGEGQDSDWEALRVSIVCCWARKDPLTDRRTETSWHQPCHRDRHRKLLLDAAGSRSIGRMAGGAPELRLCLVMGMAHA